MSFNDGQHIAANDDSIGVTCGMMGLLGNEFIVELCACDSAGQSIRGLIQERHIQGLQGPHSSREVIAAENIYDRSSVPNT